MRFNSYLSTGFCNFTTTFYLWLYVRSMDIRLSYRTESLFSNFLGIILFFVLGLRFLKSINNHPRYDYHSLFLYYLYDYRILLFNAPWLTSLVDTLLSMRWVFVVIDYYFNVVVTF